LILIAAAAAAPLGMLPLIPTPMPFSASSLLGQGLASTLA
jgi:hypothetical protein